jgi:hypothetical protein
VAGSFVCARDFFVNNIFRELHTSRETENCLEENICIKLFIVAVCYEEFILIWL